MTDKKQAVTMDSLPVMVEVEQGDVGEDVEDQVLSLDLSPTQDVHSDSTVDQEETSPEESAVAAETADDSEDEARLEHAAPTIAIRYVGGADVFEYGEIRFRRGLPVEVPTADAEKLLRYRNERFEAVKE